MPGSRRGKSGSPAWTDDDAVALDDPYDSLQIVSVTSCLGRQWQQQWRRRGRAYEPDLPPSPITPLTGRRGEACLPSCAAAAASPVRTRQAPGDQSGQSLRAARSATTVKRASDSPRGCGAAVARARRGGWCLAEPADSVAGAWCGGRRWVTPIARAAACNDLERHDCRPSQSNLRGRADRPAEPRYLLTRLAYRPDL